MACNDIKKSKLTPKMKHFAELYVVNGNATRSYIEAYNKEVGGTDSASYKLCKNEAHLLLKNEVVKTYIDELTSQRSPLAKEEWIIDKLLEIINNPEAKDADKLKAMDMILKCTGSYTTNQNINAKVEANTETVITVTIEDEEEDEANED